ncbi:TetR/AcrR family transcriptional regulator [Methylorubrum populi]|uniref:TetR/AcrR family transcriptional regulator n=1 Tax=Methylorubrum populi TaxID=223967 RepID=UPI0031FA1C95
MARKPDISLKKQAKQSRSIATVAAIVEAATYILARDGMGGFTSNKVAERAGVNVASFYQYFPNKEALLFHIITLTWEEQLARLQPILTQQGPSAAERLRSFIGELMMVEAAEADLRRAIRAVSVELRDTSEFKSLIARGATLLHEFIADALKDRVPEDIEFVVDCTAILITSFTERATDEHTSMSHLMRQADFLSDVLIGRFGLT